MRNPATFKAIVAFIGGIAVASAAHADGITHNPDGTMSGFPSYYHAGVYCDAVQFYANGPQYFGVWKDYPAKLTQATLLQFTSIHNMFITFRTTGKMLGCKDSLGPIMEITGIDIGTEQ